ncbi:hypothetical protein SRHO_G00090090 [Serrasalmus rhombeus]
MSGVYFPFLPIYCEANQAAVREIEFLFLPAESQWASVMPIRKRKREREAVRSSVSEAFLASISCSIQTCPRTSCCAEREHALHAWRRIDDKMLEKVQRDRMQALLTDKFWHL